MAFFKFRKGADEATSAPAQPPSVEVIRQRAKYRLVGATVLVLAGVILFPLLFDSQPRSVAVNTPIDIPDKNKMSPLLMPPAVEAGKSAARTGTTPASDIITEDAEPAKTVTSSVKKPAPALAEPALGATKVESSAAAKPTPLAKPEASAAAKAAAPAAADAAAQAVLSKASDGARAKALLEGRASPDAQTVPGRFIVQVGAFADAVRAREVRMKMENAGLKTYTHVAETKEGRRIRVRVGPYPTRDEAEKAAARIRKLDLPAALLTL